MSDPGALLTIGELAEYVGVTVRAVRHYHDRGLLPEPARDASGYRRYDAQAVLDLMRIHILAEAGVPLARIGQLLEAQPEEFAAATAEIDAGLASQISDLERRRGRIADLAGGERTFLPAELAGLLDRLRAAGVRARTVEVERDAWLLLLARHPDRALVLLRDKCERLADPEFVRIYSGYDNAGDWDVSDPRLEELADEIVDYARREHAGVGDIGAGIDDPTAVGLITALVDETASPAQVRLGDLVQDRIGERSLEHGHGAPR